MTERISRYRHPPGECPRLGRNTAEPGIYDNRRIANRVSFCCTTSFHFRLLLAMASSQTVKLPVLVSKGPRASRGKDTSSAAVPAPLLTIFMKLLAQNAKERCQPPPA